MRNSGHAARKRTHLAVVVVVASVFLPAGRAQAQAGGDPVTAPSGGVHLSHSGQFFGAGREGGQPLPSARPPEPATILAGSIRRSLATAAADSGVVLSRPPALVPKAPPAGRQRSTGRKVLGAAIGAVGGFFGGGFLGAAIEGDRCGCDDPGLQGFIVGAPIGAVAGGILGAISF